MAVAPPQHPRQEQPRQDDRRAQVDVQRVVDVLDLQVDQPAAGRHAGVGDQDVHVAGRGRQALGLAPLGQVGRLDGRVLQLLGDGFQLLPVAPADHEPRAFLAEAAGDDRPQSRGRPGQKHLPAVQVMHVSW